MIENTKSIISEAPTGRALEVRSLLDDLGLSDGRLTPEELHDVVRAVASAPHVFTDLIVDDEVNRWWLLLFQTDNFEVRILGWEHEQRSDWHDHGGSSGAFVVTQGTLFESYRAADNVSIATRTYGVGDHGSFGPEHVHDVVHVSGKPAVSIHAYSPPLSGLTTYVRSPFGFVAREFVEEKRRSGSRTTPPGA